MATIPVEIHHLQRLTAQLEATLAAAQHTPPPLPVEAETHTLGELLAAYSAEYLPSKAKTTRYQQRRLHTWIVTELGDVPLSDLTPARLRQWRDRLVAQYKSGTVRRYLDILSAPLQVAVRDYEWLDANPLRKVQKPTDTARRTRFLSHDERQRLLAACQQSRNPALYTLVLLAITTGARKGELLGLHWTDVDFERGLVSLRETKNGDSRSVPLSAIAQGVLQVWTMHQRKGIPLVFPRLDGKAPMDIDRSFENAVDKAGMEDFHFHDLRHTAASYLAMTGASLRDIAEILGHHSIQMTRRYTHLMTNHTSAVVERMSAKYFGETSQEGGTSHA